MATLTWKTSPASSPANQSSRSSHTGHLVHWEVQGAPPLHDVRAATYCARRQGIRTRLEMYLTRNGKSKAARRSPSAPLARRNGEAVSDQLSAISQGNAAAGADSFASSKRVQQLH
jgi:hypothetical protein